MIVDHDKCVPLATVMRWEKRSGDVHMDESPGVAWCVEVRAVRQSRSIGFSACVTRRGRCVRQTGGCVSGERG
eukprot:3332209-Pleurochrysis_carterae.AAC.1